MLLACLFRYLLNYLSDAPDAEREPAQQPAERQPIGWEAQQSELDGPAELGGILRAGANIATQIGPPASQESAGVAQQHLVQRNRVRRLVPAAPVTAPVDTQPDVLGLLIVERLA